MGSSLSSEEEKRRKIEKQWLKNEVSLRSRLKRIKKSFLTFENCMICYGFEHDRTRLLLEALCQEALDICGFCVGWHSSWILIFNKYDNLKENMSLNLLIELTEMYNLLSLALVEPEKSQFNHEWLEGLRKDFDELEASYPFCDEDNVEADDSQGSSSMSDVDVSKLEDSVGNSISKVSNEELDSDEELDKKLKKMDREFREDLARREAAQMEKINQKKRKREEMERGMNI